MNKWLSLPVACLLLPGAARAQDEVIDDFSAKHVEKFIKEVMKTTFKKQAFPEDDRIQYSTPAGKFDVEFRTGDKKSLAFQYPYGNLKASAAQIKEWNQREGNLSRVALRAGRPLFSGTVLLDGGVTFKKLEAVHARLHREKKAFEAFLNAPDSPVTVKPVIKKGDVVRQTFPAKAEDGEHRTKWEVEWDFVPRGRVHLLRVVSAKYSFKDRDGEWKTVTVARNLELVEAFAPYDDGVTSFLDLGLGRADSNVAAREAWQGAPCVAPPQILKWAANPKLSIFREVHDDGIRWITGYSKNRAYRGEKLVLLSVFQAVNYVYLVEYDFTDDGRIVPKLGFTAHNFFHRGKSNSQTAKDGDVHLHVGCWRMDFDLSAEGAAGKTGGPAKNDYRLISRRPSSKGQPFQVVDEPFGADPEQEQTEVLEGKARWRPEEFTTLCVRSTEATCGTGRPIAYDLIPSRLGSVRNLPAFGDTNGKAMAFVNYDFWVTRSAAQPRPYHDVPALAKEQRPLAGQPATVYYSAPGIHVPRGEDYGVDGTTKGRGVALTTWIEFTLRPRDLCDSTPLYP
jgi:hypothetical protein